MNILIDGTRKMGQQQAQLHCSVELSEVFLTKMDQQYEGVDNEAPTEVIGLCGCSNVPLLF